MYLMHSYSVRPQGAEFYMFYGVFSYNVVTYIALVLSDPGRIEDIEYRKKLDEIVSLITELSPNIVLRPQDKVRKIQSLRNLSTGAGHWF